ncbi:MAG: T9SS C-terminal target domain-containing protein [Bacteroidetes bacterium]|nr:MAG: T9SS C-terminal target domain-containing protein [Bacteroidota bacterium]
MQHNYKHFTFFSLFVLLLVAPVGSQIKESPLSGTLTIGPGGDDDYNTFTAATNDLMTQGVGEGGVLFLVAPGTYPERVTLSNLTGTSADNPVEFRANDGIVTLTGTGTTANNDAMVSIHATSHITFDGIHVECVATTIAERVEMGYLISGSDTVGSNHNTIKNASVLMGGELGEITHHVMGVNINSTATAPSGANNFNTIHNMTIDNVSTGVRIAGKQLMFGEPEFPDTGNTISNCTFGETLPITSSTGTAIGIRVRIQENVTISDNIIADVFSNPEVAPVFPANVEGINMFNCGGDVFNNQVQRVYYLGQGPTTVNGIYMNPTENDTIRLYNNFISNLYKAPGYNLPSFDNSTTIKGIYIAKNTGGGGLVQAWFNTVVLDHPDPSPYVSGSLIMRSFSGGSCYVEIYNNIFINNLVPAGTNPNEYTNSSFAIIDGNTDNEFLSGDNNLLYVSHPDAFIAQKGRRLGTAITNCTTLEEWSEIAEMDYNSVSKSVNFVDLAGGDLHLAGASISDPQLAGIAIEGVDFDIDYDPRAEIPGMGADEYDPSDAVVSVSGTVSDDDTGNPLQGVSITLGEFSVMTNASGLFSLNILPGMYTLTAEKEDYFPFSQEMEILPNDTVLEIYLTPVPIPMALVTGIIEGSDMPGTGLEGAFISFLGEEEFLPVYTNEQGEFSLEIPANITYSWTAAATGYEPATGTFTPEEGDFDMGVIVLNEYPFAPLNATATQEEDLVTVSWDAPVPGLFTAFRYDNGTLTGQLGYQNGTENSVLGAVHRRNAVLHQISWFLSSEGGPHNLVNIFVFGLDEEGMPDRENILYLAPNINNTDNQWNDYTLTESLSAPNGFLIGVSTSGFLALGHDAGEEPWPFQPETQFATPNFLQNDFVTMESMNFQVNFLIRAHGIDFGPALFDKSYTQTSPNLLPVHQPMAVEAQQPVRTRHMTDQLPRVLNHYKVYRLEENETDNEQSWTLLSDDVTDLQYIDTDWLNQEPGQYLYAVKAAWSGGVVSEPAFTNTVTMSPDPEPVHVTLLTVGPSGNPVPDAMVVLNHQQGESFSGTTNQEGLTVFEDVPTGQYELTVTAEGYHPYHEEEIQISQSTSLTAELEVITHTGLLQENTIVLYPNPATRQFFIESDKNIRQLEVFNTEGKLIYIHQPQQEKIRVNTEAWEAGQYIIVITHNQGEQHTLKWQKQ